MNNYTSEQIKKHGDLINLWEKSEPKPVIQVGMIGGGWGDVYKNNPMFDVSLSYRVKPKSTREEITAQWVKDNDLKVGDKVKIVSSFSNIEYRIPIGENWKAVNCIYPVDKICKRSILFDTLGSYWEFPIECLEKVKDEYVSFTFEDRELFQSKWVKQKIQEFDFLPTYVDINGIGSNCDYYTYQEAFEKLEFIDKTPFGKKL